MTENIIKKTYEYPTVYYTIDDDVNKEIAKVLWRNILHMYYVYTTDFAQLELLCQITFSSQVNAKYCRPALLQ